LKRQAFRLDESAVGVRASLTEVAASKLLITDARRCQADKYIRDDEGSRIKSLFVKHT